MLSVKPRIIIAFFSLLLISSCGFIKIDTSVAAEQFTDFSGTEEDCGCIDEPLLDKICPKVYAPVCGCDANSYRNECEARRVGVISFSPGPCIWDFYTVY